MLGPVVTLLALLARHRAAKRAGGGVTTKATRVKLVPWFVVGFVILAALRSIGVISTDVAAVSKSVAGWLTIAAMAALGLSVDVHSVKRVGARVALAVSASLTVLMLFAILLIRVFAIR